MEFGTVGPKELPAVGMADAGVAAGVVDAVDAAAAGAEVARAGAAATALWPDAECQK